MSQVRFVNVTKKFDEVIAVNYLNLTIKEGEFFTFLGPSGCGKTTSLRMVAGFSFPTSGRILFEDRDITDVPVHQRNTGMVFQNYALFPHMTVFENVAFGLQVRKRPKIEIQERVRDVLNLVRLNGFEMRKMSQLSGGQQQRVALARALVIRPDVLLLDEPLSNLDARLRDEMRSEILQLQRSLGITTIYVTHDQGEALTMSSRIAVFNQGICQQVGTPSEIYQHPANAFVASFVGESNLIPVARWNIEEGNLWAEIMEVGKWRVNTQEIPDPNQSVALLMRPESVKIVTEPTENCLSATVTLIEYQGATSHVTFQTKTGWTLQAMVTNVGWNTQCVQEGERLWLHFPPEDLQFVATGERKEECS